MIRGIRGLLLFPVLLTVILVPVSFILYRNNQRLQRACDDRTRRLEELMNIETISPEDLDDLKTRYLWSLSKYGRERNLYLFSQSVKDALEDKGLSVLRYSRRVQKDETYIEFTLEGDVKYYFRFLKSFYQESRAFKIPYFTIDLRDKGAQITFLIGFDSINEELVSDLPLTEGIEWSDSANLKERMNPESLARIFYIPKKPEAVPVVREEPVLEVIPPSPDRFRFQYVGKVGTPEGVKYYMKELNSNRIITVPSEGWTLLEQKGTSIRFGYDESVYEVPLL